MTTKITQYIRFLLFYTWLVILWGAWVRISRSGDGCGKSWPLCHGEVIPTGASLPTWVEFSHRLMSGLYGFLILGLVVVCFRITSKGHPLRKSSLLALLLTISEALIGAGLVLKGLVVDNASVTRAVAMGLHMLNSLLLVGSLALCYVHANIEKFFILKTKSFQKNLGRFLIIGFLTVASTGALAALASSLFQTVSLEAGLAADLSSDSHFLLRLRIWHPISATLLGLATLLFASKFYYSKSLNLKATVTNELSQNLHELVRKRSKILVQLILVGVAFGFTTLFMLSPTWMKLAHLQIAHFIWVSLLILFWSL